MLELFPLKWNEEIKPLIISLLLDLPIEKRWMLLKLVKAMIVLSLQRNFLLLQIEDISQVFLLEIPMQMHSSMKETGVLERKYI